MVINAPEAARRLFVLMERDQPQGRENEKCSSAMEMGHPGASSSLGHPGAPSSLRRSGVSSSLRDPGASSVFGISWSFLIFWDILELLQSWIFLMLWDTLEFPHPLGHPGVSSSFGMLCTILILCKPRMQRELIYLLICQG